MIARTKRKLKTPLKVKRVSPLNKLQRREYLAQLKRKTNKVQKREQARIDELQKITSRNVKIIKSSTPRGNHASGIKERTHDTGEIPLKKSDW